MNLSGGSYLEDTTNFSAKTGSDQFATNASIPSDVVAFAIFMRLLAPPTASTTTRDGATSISNGRALFSAIGCEVETDIMFGRAPRPGDGHG